MASSESLSAYFEHIKARSGIVVEDLPKFDLDSYIKNYEGRTRYDRLLLIGQTSVPLCVDALKAAVAEAKKGKDVERYKEAWDHVREAAPGEPEAKRDDAWIEAKEKANRVETARLEAELKGYKNNLIKESIRMGNEDIGRHYEEIGALKEAAEAYSRMRHDVSSTKHILDCSQHLINVALERRDWSGVITNVNKMGGIQGVDGEKDMQPYFKVAGGLGYLGLGKFQEAALSLIQANSGGSWDSFEGLVTPNDIATYGGLLALASMGRNDLQTKVLESSTFRAFLEYEPNVRRAINLFINGRYSQCLSILDSMRTDCLLDVFLQKHVAAIYSQIRRKCIVQYIIPFSCVTLQSLDDAFGRANQPIEDELVSMIRDNALSARIDSKSKVLVAVSPDPRAEMQQVALDVARKYEQEAKERLRRINIVAAGLEATRLRRQADEHWYDPASAVSG